MDSRERVRTPLDPDRLSVAGALAVEPGSTAELIEPTNLSELGPLTALGAPRSAGLAKWEDQQHSLCLDGLRELACDLSDTELPMDPVIGFGMTHEERAVLFRFFEGHTLTSVPASRAKRLVVLKRLALEFDLDRYYSEAEVDGFLRAFNPDWSMLRRYPVDEGFLDREARGGGNRYWRSGGRATAIT